MPVSRPRYREPSASQLSSTTHRSCCVARSATTSRSNGHAERVRHHDRARPGPDRLAQPVGIGGVVAEVDVDEDRHQVVLQDRRDRRRKRRPRPSRTSSPGLQPAVAELRRRQGRQRDEVCRRPGVHQQRIATRPGSRRSPLRTARRSGWRSGRSRGWHRRGCRAPRRRTRVRRSGRGPGRATKARPAKRT